jgi:putative Mn2+ efflux pump MntP
MEPRKSSDLRGFFIGSAWSPAAEVGAGPLGRLLALAFALGRGISPYDVLSILILAVGLAMDSAAAAASIGVTAGRTTWRQKITVAGIFGAGQVVMPLLGWLLGSAFGRYVRAWDHWIAFVLLAGIGGKMIHDAWGGPSDAEDDVAPAPAGATGAVEAPGATVATGAAPLARPGVLLLTAVATSVDSFAAGIALPLIEAPLVLSVAVIGGITAAMSALGLWAGGRFGGMLGSRLDVLGGAVLIGLGCKILVEHLSGAA